MWSCSQRYIDLLYVATHNEVVHDYDAVSTLDPWMTTILLRIKKTIDSEELR